MSVEHHKNPIRESRLEALGRWGQALGFLGGAAIALASWSIAAGMPFFLYTEAGSTVMRLFGKQNREKPKRESFFKRHTVKAVGAH